jgi:hypothetical protein
MTESSRHGPASLTALLRRVAWLEPTLYGLVAGAATLYVATRFYGSLKLQLAYAQAWARHDEFGRFIEASGYWSAPLDDVFIHFDFARSIVRGHPFEWSSGAGYSSGGTSLLYPFLLALGVPLGFDGLRLMEWAAVVACVCVFATLLLVRRLFDGLPTWTSYVAPFAFLAIGALDWTLFSGMEVALFLAVWAGCVYLWDELRREGASGTDQAIRTRTWQLGLGGAALVATRPESAVLVALFAATAAYWLLPRGRRSALRTLLIAGAPGAAIVLAHAVANRVLTGSTTAAGALVKLEAHHPYFTGEQVLDAWWFHLKYQVLRLTQYHVADPGWFGWLLWLLAAAAFIPRATRRSAALLWISAALWMVIVAFNGQVRWQNERYSMPALAWILLAAGLGLGGLLAGLRATERRALRWAGGVAGVAAALTLSFFQAPRFREQIWFFGRASRNILEQHVRAALFIGQGLPRKPNRVLVGDAGAIPYASDVPALDIIGLGGFRGLPFAQATRAHVGAGLELVERIEPQERPELMAIYPSWWGELPLWFGQTLAQVPVRGNVICGGASKVLYRADYSAFEGSAFPSALRSGERVSDDIDIADLVSEQEHGYELSPEAIGYVTMKLLAHPQAPRRDLWDAGRIVAPGASESFRLLGTDPRRPFRLVARAAPSGPLDVPVAIGGRALGSFRASAADGWQELSLDVPALGDVALEVKLGVSPHERVFFHVWAVQPP